MENTKLFTCLFGSRLYGTQTPTSDLDIKHVVLPNLDDLLMGRGVKNSFKKTNNVKNVRNSSEDVDEEFIPLQVFARDFMEGQTYALELAFSIDGTHAQQTFYHPDGTVDWSEPGGDLKQTFKLFVSELRKHYLTSNIKAMMGYVVNQASMYSFKGERLNVVRELQVLLNEVDMYYKSDDVSLSALDAPAWATHVQRLTEKYPKYFRKDEYDIGGGRMKPCLMILEKTLPYTNTLEHSMKVVDALIKKYGTRAESASESNVDWKATMHAVRIVDEGLQLLTDHKLEFPFKPEYVERLLAMKRGELPLDPIKDELVEKLDRLKELERTTTLKSANELRPEFETWLKGWLRNFYEV
jgi:hypothetical protein